MTYKVIFAGTPEIACPTLTALISDKNYELIAVYTQPDRPAGRGRRLQPSPVKQLALQENIPVYQPSSMRKTETIGTFKKHNADIMIVFAYGCILPSEVLSAPKYGCINCHVSILPQWRGAAPIARAILAGDQTTGVSIMKMDEGLDTGPVYLQSEITIDADDTTQSLSDKLSQISATSLTEILPNILENKCEATEQNDRQATYAHKLEKSDGAIQWQNSAEQIERQVRACNPWPVTYCMDDQQLRWRIWSAKTASIQDEIISNKNKSAQPGQIIHADADGIYVATGEGVLIITELQKPGGRRMETKSFYHNRAAGWENNNILS